MEQRPMQGMWGRYALFVVLALAVLVANAYFMSKFSPQRKSPETVSKKAEPRAKKGEQAAGGVPAAAKAAAGGKKQEGAAAAKAEPAAKPAPPKPVAPEPEIPETSGTLGSLDPASPYRMRVTWTSRGAAVRRIELNSPRYRDLDDRRRPLEIIRYEDQSPPSFLIGLTQIDDETLPGPEGAGGDPKAAASGTAGGGVDRELEGAALRIVNWEVVSHDDTEVKFRRVLPRRELEVTKTFRLAKVSPEDENRGDARDYHLTFDFEIRNTAKRERKVAYYVDGPNSLPVEGWWYAYKVSRTWGGAGLRDVIVSFQGDVHTVSAIEIGGGKTQPLRRDQPMDYIGVDAQYFSVIMIPQGPDANEVWFSEWQPLGYGKPEADMPPNTTNASFRVTSTVRELKPGGGLPGSFEIFAGPKKPDLLSQYGLGEIVYYGWFKLVAELLLAILHTFYKVIPNYGVAIILLTALVRCCMFPLSRKQALSAQKMQELQPEIKKIQEKYKNNLEARGKAQQELFRKHKYNPMGGCLIAFIQLPIFIGLWKALTVDVELRQAPLIPESIPWASNWATNLAAPDMLFNWSSFMPAFVNRGVGMFGLGPYFNLLPVVSVLLFLWQQKKMMPPPTDEQQVMQQRIMQFMMVFMGIMLYKVASGLGVYFIASSLWGIAERKFLPKVTSRPDTSAASTPPTPRTVQGRDGASAGKRKARGKRR